MNKAVYVFTNDLRLDDNIGLLRATAHYDVLPAYIYDPQFFTRPLGGASRVWLHYSLQSLQTHCPQLSLYSGNWVRQILNLIDQFGLTHVFVSRQYTAIECEFVSQLASELHARDIELTQTPNTLLWEPESVLKSDGTPYRVFTPFYKKGCLTAAPPALPRSLNTPSFITDPNAAQLCDLQLLTSHHWETKITAQWDISIEGATTQLNQFITNGLSNYKDGRNMPALPCVSRLSPYIRFGNIGIRQIWHTATSSGDSKHIDHFLSELGWREFSYHLLFHFPKMLTHNLQAKFDRFPWTFNETFYDAWVRGMTGYPLVDAGMRELWETGYIHNRVRMVVGSFLVKNLLIDWRYGEKWFWDCLMDADIANNTAGWQWIAGCGADAAPYFRVFNPVMQGQKFDPQGDYTLKYLPELQHLPKSYLYSPWEAPESVLKAAGVVLGKDYPHPIVNLQESRETALSAFSQLKA